MKNYAFIFARGGSKGLPGKNIKRLAGKPLLQYSIEVAKSCSSIDKVFVSTDDASIAEVALANSAILIERPEKLASDTSPEWLSWIHAVEWVTDKYGPFDRFVSLPATSPLRNVEDVEGAINQIKDSEADVCIGITPANRSPYFNMVRRDENGNVQLMNLIDGGVARRQDAPAAFDITTVVYVTYPSYIIQNQSLFAGRVTSIEVPKARAVDIDDIYDFKLAEAIVEGGL